MTVKPKVATVWLEGCAGCHMSFLDLDERLLDILGKIQLTVSPITDFKDYDFSETTLGIIEGAVGNEEQEEVVHRLRRCSSLVMAWGDCAVFGGINTLRNQYTPGELIRAGYIEPPLGPGQVAPNDPVLPRLLPRVVAVDQVVTVDIHVPGCPPSPQVLFYALGEILGGRRPRIPPDILHYD
jgi:NAD-reducing hydrogenase small subunit